MKLNSSLPYGEDYSTVVLALYLLEVGFEEQKFYDVVDFNVYLYRFYSDNERLRKNHYNKMVNELFHYQPSDFYEYTKGILVYVEQTTKMIFLNGTKFKLTHCPTNVNDNLLVISNLIQILAAKYLGNDSKKYSSRISADEIREDGYYVEGTRIFNRAREKCNYCFLCDENEYQKLCAIRLSDNTDYEYDMDNYLILCKGHGAMYLDGTLKIGRNGYPYVYGERKYEHIEIGVLKEIRNFLSGLEEK